MALIRRTLTVAAMACCLNSAYASVNQVSLPVSESGAYWQSLDVVGERTLWLGSNQGDVAISQDGGESWTTSRPVGSTSTLPITGITALDQRQAYALTSGRGNDSRLYHTRNAGFSWNRVHRGDGDENLRCFDVIPDGEAWILGNTVNDNWHVVRSANGRTWLSSRSGFNREAQLGEGAFNESASCLRHTNNTWVMGSGYASTARIMYKSTTALRFNVVDTPITGTNSAVTAVWPLPNRDILLVGGELNENESAGQVYRYQNGDFESFSTPLTGTLTNLLAYGDYILVGNKQGIAWTRQLQYDAEWHIEDVPVRQLRCSENRGCFALSEQGLFQFEPDH